MKYKSHLYLISLLVMVTIITGCGTGVSGQGKVFIKDAPLARQQPSPSVTKIIRFVPEPTEAPLPHTGGVFIDERHVWAKRDNDLVRTIDGGRTWQRFRLTTDDEDVFGRPKDMFVRYFFVSPTRGWLITDSGTWQTEDGALTWRRISTDGFDGFAFSDEKYGWVNVYNKETGYQSNITEDGGQTWKPCGPKRKEGQISYSAYFLTPQIGWAITSQTINRQTTDGVAFTSDAGCHWRQLWVSNKNPDESYSDIYFLNEKEGWLAGSYIGSLYHTLDGGKTWQEIQLPREKMRVTSIYFTSQHAGWILVAPMSAGDIGVYHTTNGGNTWERLAEEDITSSSVIPLAWKAGKLIQLLYACKAYR